MPREHSGDFISIDGHIAVDQQPFVKAIVKGSKHISRDLMENAESVLDVEGNGAYHREAQKGEWEDFLYCACKTHRGARWLPFTQFGVDNSNPNGRNRWCLGCRAEAEHDRRMKEAARRGVHLRNKPGRPPKWQR